jgi:hypothetical protein
LANKAAGQGIDPTNGKHTEAKQLGIVTSTAEAVYDFVTNPANWTKTYPAARTPASCRSFR